MMYKNLNIYVTCLAALSLLLIASCGKEDFSIQSEEEATKQYIQLESRTTGSCETIPGFYGRGIYAEEAASNDVYSLVSNPFGQTGVDYVYGGEVAFLVPDEQDPSQMNPVYSVGGAMDEDIFAEFDGETITVYYKTNNEYLKSLGADAGDNIVSIPEAIYELLESESSTAKDEFSKSGMQSELTENGIMSNIIEGSLSVTSRNSIQILNPDDGEQYLRINQCRFILASTVRRYRTEFVDAYAIITPDSNLDFAISDAVKSCSPSFCKTCPISSCVISEIISDPRISGASLVVNSLKLNFARVAFDMDETNLGLLGNFIDDIDLNDLISLRCESLGVGEDEQTLPNSCEQDLVFQSLAYFNAARQILPNKNIAYSATNAVSDINNSPYVNNCPDAFRHAYFNALNTRSVGVSIANEFGVAHECVNGAPALDEQMDLFNNIIGQQIAVDEPMASNEDLISLIEEAIEEQELKRIFPLSAGNGIISSSILINTVDGCL